MKARHGFNKDKAMVLDLEAENGEEALVLQEVWVDYVLVPKALLSQSVVRLVAVPITDLGAELGVKLAQGRKAKPVDLEVA